MAEGTGRSAARNADQKTRTALVTGAAVRIGRATALALADAGLRIVVHYRRSRTEAETLCEEIEARGVRAWPVQADFVDEREPGRLIDRAFEVAGSVEVLVNNAASFPKDDLDSLTFEGLTENMRVNAWAPFALARAFVHRAKVGHVVNLLDSRVVDADWTHVGYIASKHVLTALTKMMALAWAPDIAVNGVAPGLILPPPGAPHEYIDRLTKTVPLQQHGAPEEVARAVVYLVGSRFVTGEVIFVDGGRHMREYERRG